MPHDEKLAELMRLSGRDADGTLALAVGFALARPRAFRRFATGRRPLLLRIATDPETLTALAFIAGVGIALTLALLRR